MQRLAVLLMRFLTATAMSRKISTQAALSVVIATDAALFWLRLPRALAAPPPGSVLLQLPAIVTIHSTKGQTYSGVQLLEVNPSRVTYQKGGKRSLAASQVWSIGFRGKVFIGTNRLGPIRGVGPKGCPPKADEVLVATAALAIQPGGRSLSMLPAQLPKIVSMDLQQTSQRRTLVVNELRFDPGGKVRVVFKACAPEA